VANFARPPYITNNGLTRLCSQMELVLPLPGIHFRLRLDKVSPEAQTRLLYELVYLPLLSIANAVQRSNEDALQALQHVRL
jgi:hypothetical protein